MLQPRGAQQWALPRQFVHQEGARARTSLDAYIADVVCLLAPRPLVQTLHFWHVGLKFLDALRARRMGRQKAWAC